MPSDMDPRECRRCLRGLLEVVPGCEVFKVKCNECGDETQTPEVLRRIAPNMEARLEMERLLHEDHDGHEGP